MCKICEAGEIGHLWSRDLTLGKKNIEEAAIYFRCSRSDVLTHLNSHEMFEDASGNYDSPDFYMGKLLKILRTLEDMANYDLLSTNDLTRQDKEILIKILKECRDTLKVIGEFQGRISSSKDVTINVELINTKYQQITNMLITEVCPECRLKIVNMLDKMETPAIIG